jgi:hypothetical protein
MSFDNSGYAPRWGSPIRALLLAFLFGFLRTCILIHLAKMLSIGALTRGERGAMLRAGLSSTYTFFIRYAAASTCANIMNHEKIMNE